jgi:ribosome-binding factor A
MSARRLLKAAEAIREVVSMAILTELRDPRVKNVTVLGVEVAPDMREAKVLVSIMGNDSQQKTTLKGLQNASGFLQTRIAERIDTRYTPRLTFVTDEGVKKSVAVQQILEQIARERAASSPSPTSTSDEIPDNAEGHVETDRDEVLDTAHDTESDNTSDKVDLRPNPSSDR